jgi:FixJ family two-component response regulator
MIPLYESINKTGLDVPNTDSFNAFEKLAAKGSPLSASGWDGIWLLDDDVSMLKALGRLMNSVGFIVEKFNHPAAFLARLEHAPCRVAVLDVWMPDMNGLEVQACLRRDSPETRIIFISGRDDPPVRRTALDAGAFAFLAKPFEDEALVQLVHKAVAD